MNIDNQLMLGIVFLTAGVAMGLLAYAAVLNRRSDEETVAESELPPEAEPAEDEAAVSQAQEETPAETPGMDAPSEPVEPMSASMASDAAAPPQLTIPSSALADEAEPQAPAPPADAKPDAPPAQATLQRDLQSGRLVIQVDDSTYRSIEALRESDDWPRVDHLFSDLLAWLYKVEALDRAREESTQTVEQPPKPAAPMSMVEQINEILSAKLEEQPGTTPAVHLLEGPGGSIRVYIGVNSYAIEEVPDDNVRKLIRQAVTEWESRQ